jgi:hypothetical protein
MPILSILLVLIVVGVCLYLLNLIPMDATIKRIVQVVAMLLVVVWILRVLFPSLWVGPVT